MKNKKKDTHLEKRFSFLLLKERNIDLLKLKFSL